MITKDINGYFFGGRTEVSVAAGDAVVALLTKAVEPPRSSNEPLHGRTMVRRGTIPGIGPVIVKSYRRGGIWSWLGLHWYLGLGPTRSQIEFEMLTAARAVGISAPDPIAFVRRGGFFYRCWLVTHEIEGVVNLSDLARVDEGRVRIVLEKLVEALSLLIRNRICHVDLHPGNILVDQNNCVYVIDFDKARLFEGRLNDLRDLYLHRWRRAVIKHDLPDLLAEGVCVGLRRNYEIP